MVGTPYPQLGCGLLARGVPRYISSARVVLPQPIEKYSGGIRGDCLTIKRVHVLESDQLMKVAVSLHCI
jgi:hypothetical protein